MAAPSTLLTGVSSAMMKSLPESLQQMGRHACACERCVRRQAGPVSRHEPSGFEAALRCLRACKLQAEQEISCPAYLSFARRETSQATSRSLRLRAAQAANTMSTCRTMERWQQPFQDLFSGSQPGQPTSSEVSCTSWVKCLMPARTSLLYPPAGMWHLFYLCRHAPL